MRYVFFNLQKNGKRNNATIEALLKRHPRVQQVDTCKPAATSRLVGGQKNSVPRE